MSLDRVLPSGMRWRLALWVATVMLLSYAAIFTAVYRGTGTQIRDDIAQDLRGDMVEFSTSLAAAHETTPRAVAEVASRYVNNQPFSTTSTLLFASIPGAGTSTNQPELFSTQPDAGETIAQQAAENVLDGRLLTVPDGPSTLRIAEVGKVSLLKRAVTVGRLRVTLGVGESLATVDRAQLGVARAFLVAGVLALVVALIASLLVGTRVSGPLRRMAAIASRVNAGELYPRIPLRDGRRDEVRVLAHAFNNMLDRLTTAFAGQRAFVADASHELRTPLTVIAGQLEVLAADPDPGLAEVRRVERLVQVEIARLSRLADDLLLLVQVEEPAFLRIGEIDLSPYVEDLWHGVTAVAAGRAFEIGPVPDGVLRADPDRLAQALRNLTTNAVIHAPDRHGVVRLEVDRLENGWLRFTVVDNGDGIPAHQLERVFDRFYRTDAARSRERGGTGLGLAIVRAVAIAHGGRATATAQPGGGARIVIEIPGFTPQPDAAASGRSRVGD